MKTDSLEDYIRSNREAFDELEPDPGMWDKISPNLPRPATQRRLKLFIRIGSIAAIFIAGYLFSVWTNQSAHDNRQAVEIPSESLRMLNEAKAFYTGQIEERSQQLFDLSADQPKLRDDLQKEFNELDAMYATLEKDLGDQVATEAVVEAMIQHYRIKLQLLEDMLQQLQINNRAAKEEVPHVL